MTRRAFWILVGVALAWPLLLVCVQGPSFFTRTWLWGEAFLTGLLASSLRHRALGKGRRRVVLGLFVILSVGSLAVEGWSERRAVRRVRELTEIVDSVSADATPVLLLAPLVQTQWTEGGHTSRLVFPRSKNEPLGVLEFRAEVIAGDLRIGSFGPPSGSGFVARGKWSSLTGDGRSAEVRYSLEGVTDPVLLLMASGSGSVRIRGTQLREAFDLALP